MISPTGSALLVHQKWVPVVFPPEYFWRPKSGREAKGFSPPQRGPAIPHKGGAPLPPSGGPPPKNALCEDYLARDTPKGMPSTRSPDFPSEAHFKNERQIFGQNAPVSMGNTQLGNLGQRWVINVKCTIPED